MDSVTLSLQKLPPLPLATLSGLGAGYSALISGTTWGDHRPQGPPIGGRAWGGWLVGQRCHDIDELGGPGGGPGGVTGGGLGGGPGGGLGSRRSVQPCAGPSLPPR